jgi:uncharacterized Zn-finger protein
MREDHRSSARFAGTGTMQAAVGQGLEAVGDTRSRYLCQTSNNNFGHP